MQRFKDEPLKLPKIREVPGWRLDTMSPKLKLQPLVLTPFKVSSKKDLNISPRYPRTTRLPKLLVPITPRIEENTDQYLLENKLYKLDLPEPVQRDPSFLYSRHSYSGSSLSDTSNLKIPSIEFSVPLSGTRTQMSLNKNEYAKSFKGSEELSDVSGNIHEFSGVTKKSQESKAQWSLVPPDTGLKELENRGKTSGNNKEKRIKRLEDAGIGYVKTDSEEAKGFCESKISLRYPKDSDGSAETFKVLNEEDEQMSLDNLHYDLLKPFDKVKDSSRISENLVLDHKVRLKRKSFDDCELKNDNNTLPERFFSESILSISEEGALVSFKNESDESLEVEDRKCRSVQYRIEHGSQASEGDSDEDGKMKKRSREKNKHEGQYLNNSSESSNSEIYLKPTKYNAREKGLLNVGKLKVVEVSTENNSKSKLNIENPGVNNGEPTEKIKEKTSKPQKTVASIEQNINKPDKQLQKAVEKVEPAKHSANLNSAINKEPQTNQDPHPTDKLESSKTVKAKKLTKKLKKNTSPGKKLTKPSPPQNKPAKKLAKKGENLKKGQKTGKAEKVQLYKINGKEMQINIKELTAHNSPQSPDSLKDAEPQPKAPKDQTKPQDTQATMENRLKKNSSLLKNPKNLPRNSLKLTHNPDSPKNSPNLTTSSRLSLKLTINPDSPKTLSNSAKLSLNPDPLKKSQISLKSNRNSSIDSLFSIMKKNPVNSFIQNFSASLLRTIRSFAHKKLQSKGPKKKPGKKLKNQEASKISSVNAIEKSVTEVPSISESKEKLVNSSTSNFISKASMHEKPVLNLSMKNSDHSLQSKASVFSKYKGGKKHYIKKLEVSLNSKNSSISVIKKDLSDESSSISYEESESLEEDSGYSELEEEESEEESLELPDMEQRIRSSAMYELENYELIKNMAMSIYENNLGKGKDSELLGRNLTLKLDSVTEIDESRSKDHEKPQNDISKSEFDAFFAKPVEKFIFFRDEKGTIMKNNKVSFKISEKLEEEPENEIKARTENKKLFLKNVKNSQQGLKNAEYAYLEIIPTEEFITEKLKLNKNSRLLQIDQDLKPQKNT